MKKKQEYVQCYALETRMVDGALSLVQAILMVEGHMDDGLTMSRAQEEENKSARVIRKCTSLISRFVK